MGFRGKGRRLEARFLRSDGTPSFSSKIYEKPGEVGVIARKPVVTATSTTPVIEALKVMASRGFRRLPVTSPGGKLLGIVTAMDFMNYFGGGDKFELIANKRSYKLYAALNEPLNSIMTREVVKAGVDETFIDVLARMVKYNVGAIPIVTREDKVFGIITERDVVNHLAEKITGKSVGEVMSSDVVTAKSDNTLEEALKSMVSNGFRRLPVTDDGELKGILVAMDVIRFLGSRKLFDTAASDDIREVLKVRIDKLMTSNVVTISPDRDIGEAADLMRRTDRGSLLVVENGELVGIITERDLLLAIALE
ncbi:MAG: CBS domain-containing protein [Candidatus Nezhaarchaeota archaeon]|nr:CBS domain-containing protein [Candidatus Nezhaarchaeota archaeon]